MRERRWQTAGIATAAAAVVVVGVIGGARPRTAEADRSFSAHGARVELGRRLFFDPAVTLSGLRACAECHDPEHGFSDEARKSLDLSGTTSHHAQTLIDVADAKSFHWRGELRSIADVVKNRMRPIDVYL